jgi:hypothetical protein
VVISRALPAINGLDYYEIPEYIEFSVLVSMRFAHWINHKTFLRVCLNGFDVGFICGCQLRVMSHLCLQRSDASFADIAGVNIKQNGFVLVKGAVVKTADFIGHRFLYGGFHNGLEFFGLAFHETTNRFSPLGVLGVQNLGKNNTIG